MESELHDKIETLESKELQWAEMLEEALTLPGRLGDVYNRFYEYSFANQLLLFMQGVREPVATYKRWQEMGRQVQKGSRAKSILRPIMATTVNEAGEEETRVRGFKLVRCLFTASETDGEPLPEVEPKQWDPDRALEALRIREVPFRELNGNIQGYSFERNLAINPVAAYPLKTLLHETAHIVLGHTRAENRDDYVEHRGVAEFQAEATAYLCMHELEADEHMNAAESRAYIQGWLRNKQPPEQAIKQVFAATPQILRAGRSEPAP